MSNELSNVKMGYEINGESVNLTMNTVRNYLVRGNADKVTDSEIVMFMNLCKYQKLNPFLNEAYLVKFGQDAQIIVGKEAFMKRAESNPNYEGFEAGVIVLAPNGEMVKRDGTFSLETEKLVGGWAKVYRGDRKMPVIAEVSFKEYNKNQSTWKQIPGTMIRKVALVQALRESFPDEAGAMYVAEEISDPIDVTESVRSEVKKEIQQNANVEELNFDEVIPAESNSDIGEFLNQRGESITSKDEVPFTLNEAQADDEPGF